MTTAGNRFTPGPRTYRATYPDSPTRDTRAEAEQDWCSHYTNR